MGPNFVVIVATIFILFLGNNGNSYVDAKEIVVGDDQGWHIPDTPSFYSSWASEQKFSLGDTLVFNFPGFHTVALVSQDSFDKCDITNTISVITKSPAHIPLKSTGQFHFICTVPGHCLGGQKLAINVTASGHHHNHPQVPAPAPAPALMSDASSLGATHLGIFGFLASVVFVLGFM